MSVDGLVKTRKIKLTIASGGTTSGAVDLEGYQVVGIQTPSAMTGTSLTFTTPLGDTSTYIALYDKTNTQVSVTIATNAARHYELAPADFVGLDTLKVVSSGSEAAERTLYLVTRPV